MAEKKCAYKVAIELMIVTIQKAMLDQEQYPPTVSREDHLYTLRQCCIDMLEAGNYMENPTEPSPFSKDGLN